MKRDKSGRFVEGGHWREPKPYWDKGWLEHEYIASDKPASQIAAEQGCTENNILYFLKKHGIRTRTMNEVRSIRHWGSSGPDNPMFGRTGSENPNWKGGVTAERQAFYSSQGWKSVSELVYKRDRAACQRCGKQESCDGHHHIHHIVPFDVEYLRTAVHNLVLLCRDCHNFVHSKENVKGEFLPKKYYHPG